MIADAPTVADFWMIFVIFVLLVALVFFALAEMALSRTSTPRAKALAEKGAKSGRALVRLASEPARWVNPLLLTVS